MSWSLLIGLVLLANYQGGRSQCQTGALLYYLYPNGDICYWILSLHNPKNGGDSSTACKAEGGDLAYIPNIFALSTVMNLLVNNNANVSGFYAYLGYSRVDSSSSLLEIQGSRYVQDWIPWDTKMDQPLDTDLGCIALHGINGFWHDMHCANNIKALCSTPYYLIGNTKHLLKTVIVIIGSQSTVSSATTQKPPSSITTTQESITTPIITTQNPTTTTSTTRDLTTTTTSTQEPTTTTRTTQNPRTTTTTTIGPTTTTRTTQSPTTTATTRELTTTTTTTQELTTTITTTRGHSTTHGPSTTNGPTTTIKTTQDQTTSALTQVSTTTKSATTFQNPTSNNVISTTLTTHDPTTASTSAQLTSTSMEDISPPNTTECTCYCDQIQFFAAVNMTEELQAKLENLKEETRVDEESLSSSVRKRTSAHDPRPSAAYVGYLGIALLSLVFGGIFLVDCLRVILSVS
ncbi:uncharacterized protein [Argopecten irradians]|uniref:uncharacterized protein n=1 Tax=Argopecten irradians TaxID=31199 RepID=UPI00371B06BB